MQNQHYIVAVVHETSGHVAIFRVLNPETAEYMRENVQKQNADAWEKADA